MEYSRSEIDFMRKDALRRTREMHSRVNNTEEKREPEERKISRTENVKKAGSSENRGGRNAADDIFSSLFSKGKIDSDRMIIIMLIILLAKEGADLKLLIALGYIFM